MDEKKITAIMVTHDVDEAVYMSDRVVVMSRDKGRILEDLKIDLDRPRERESEEYLEYKNRLTKNYQHVMEYKFKMKNNKYRNLNQIQKILEYRLWI
ncbi:hypothetical protein [Paraclostridium sp. AKS81]|uniref:hypothetical protein n=1 Tax=Paraclostridium sp. AKS81 TaxID=2876117 RepID=UPI002FCCD1A5